MHRVGWWPLLFAARLSPLLRFRATRTAALCCLTATETRGVSAGSRRTARLRRPWSSCKMEHSSPACEIAAPAPGTPSGSQHAPEQRGRAGATFPRSDPYEHLARSTGARGLSPDWRRSTLAARARLCWYTASHPRRKRGELCSFIFPTMVVARSGAAGQCSGRSWLGTRISRRSGATLWASSSSVARQRFRIVYLSPSLGGAF